MSSTKSRSEGRTERSPSTNRNDRTSASRSSFSSSGNRNSMKLEKSSDSAANTIAKSPRNKPESEKSMKKQTAVSEKGILKNNNSNKKPNRTSAVDHGKKKEKKRKPKPRKKTAYEKIAQNLGFYVGNVILRDPRAIEAAQALDLHQNHLRRLKVKFDKIDIDGSGNIDYDEFFESVGETRSPFTDKLFSLIDLDGSGTIEFDEYVRVMATYCMFTKDEILRFCFECFDVDRSGTIDEKEFVELCKCINNASPAFPGNFKRALQEFDVNEDGLIDYAEFLEIDRRYPLILFPAFRLQDVMQRNSLGENGWLRVIENYQEGKRIEEYKATHGGRAPPDSPLTMLGKMFLPCLFREKVHIKVGADMEARHRLDE